MASSASVKSHCASCSAGRLYWATLVGVARRDVMKEVLNVRGRCILGGRLGFLARLLRQIRGRVVVSIRRWMRAKSVDGVGHEERMVRRLAVVSID